MSYVLDRLVLILDNDLRQLEEYNKMKKYDIL